MTHVSFIWLLEALINCLDNDVAGLLQAKPDALFGPCSSWVCLLLAFQGPIHPCT